MPRKIDVKGKLVESLRSGPKTWGVLQETTKLSKWSLSVYLKELINAKIVQTQVEDQQSGRPPSRIYALNPSPPQTTLSYHKKPSIDHSKELLRAIARNLRSPGKRKKLVRLLVVLNGLDTTHFYEMPSDVDIPYEDILRGSMPAPPEETDVKAWLIDSVVESSLGMAKLWQANISEEEIREVFDDLLNRGAVQFGLLRHYGLKLNKSFLAEYETAKRRWAKIANS